MIDLVYPIGKECGWGAHEELRYSIRSAVAHFADLRTVWIVGHRPVWLSDAARHLPAADPFRHNKDANLILKVAAACLTGELSDPFVRLSDDQFFLRPTSIADVRPFYVRKIRRGSRRGVGSWGKRIRHVAKWLRGRNYSTYHYDTHCPLPVSPAEFLRVMADLPWADPPGVTINTAYFNTIDLATHEPIGDRLRSITRPLPRDQVAAELDAGARYLNIQDGALSKGFKKEIAARFPHPSRFER